MNRKEKIKIIKDIQEGMSPRIAILRNETNVLILDKETKLFYIDNNTTITKNEKDKYFKECIIIEIRNKERIQTFFEGILK